MEFKFLGLRALPAVTLIAAVAAAPAKAATVTLEYNSEFSGAQAPAGVAPWLVATFDDTAAANPGDVRLTISTSGLVGSENVKQTYFNLDPALDPNNLGFTFIAGSSTGPSYDSFEVKENKLKADGDGKYDFLFNFPDGGGFDAMETVVIDISSSEVIDANSFNFLSVPSGGHGPFVAAAHIQNTTGAGTGGSGWISGEPVDPVVIPVPAAIWLFGSGLIGLAGIARRKRR